jgi:hypothetical protein
MRLDMRRIALLAAIILAAAVPAAASAKGDPDTWATVNLCDTAKRPDTIGIRASMPGAPRGTRMAMRFRVQYRTAQGWQDVKGAASTWQFVGRARGTAAESGWSFAFAHPASPVTLRGVVQLRWRKGGAVVKQQELPTEAGHRSSAGADPADYSAASCTLGS